MSEVPKPVEVGSSEDIGFEEEDGTSTGERTGQAELGAGRVPELAPWGSSVSRTRVALALCVSACVCVVRFW